MLFIERDPNKAYVDFNLWLPLTKVNINAIKGALTLVDPKDSEAQYRLYRITRNHVVVPRHYTFNFNDVELVDLRPKSFPKVDIYSKIVLDLKYPTETTQKDAVVAMLGAFDGTLQLACGGGKSVIAAEIAARRAEPTLILVESNQLLRQWYALLSKVLDIPGGIGLIQADTCDWRKPIVLGTYKTLATKAYEFPQEMRYYFGQIFWDEGHHLPAPMYLRTADLFIGRRYLLTATPVRSDGMHIISQLHTGKVVYKNLHQRLRPRIRYLS